MVPQTAPGPPDAPSRRGQRRRPLPPLPAPRYARYQRARRPPVAAGWRYVLLLMGVVTFGFAWLVGAVLCWVAFFRSRRRGELPVAPVHWLRWAVGFSLLGLIAVPVFLNAAINGN